MHTKIRKAQRSVKRGIDKTADTLVRVDKKVERKLGVSDAKRSHKR
jgi:hypothetical protein